MDNVHNLGERLVRHENAVRAGKYTHAVGRDTCVQTAVKSIL